MVFDDGSLPWIEAFEFDLVPFVYFCFCFPCLRRWVHKNITKTDVNEVATYVSF